MYTSHTVSGRNGILDLIQTGIGTTCDIGFVGIIWYRVALITPPSNGHKSVRGLRRILRIGDTYSPPHGDSMTEQCAWCCGNLSSVSSSHLWPESVYIQHLMEWVVLYCWSVMGVLDRALYNKNATQVGLCILDWFVITVPWIYTCILVMYMYLCVCVCVCVWLLFVQFSTTLAAVVEKPSSSRCSPGSPSTRYWHWTLTRRRTPWPTWSCLRRPCSMCMCYIELWWYLYWCLSLSSCGVDRIVEWPRGNALSVGVGGSVWGD